mgnify:CR=1 FL=1
MKTLKLTTILMLIMFATGQLFSQNADSGTEKEAVLKVMKSYKDALQNLTTEGTFELFAKDSEVFESGGIEGTYANYIEHHLGKRWMVNGRLLKHILRQEIQSKIL